MFISAAGTGICDVQCLSRFGPLVSYAISLACYFKCFKLLSRTNRNRFFNAKDGNNTVLPALCWFSFHTPGRLRLINTEKQTWSGKTYSGPSTKGLLPTFGSPPALVRWKSNLLSRWGIFARVNEVLSLLLPVNDGVPRGFRTCSHFFLFFINNFLSNTPTLVHSFVNEANAHCSLSYHSPPYKSQHWSRPHIVSVPLDSGLEYISWGKCDHVDSNVFENCRPYFP